MTRLAAKHYTVVTSVITSYYEDEPPEDWRDFVTVIANTKAEAKVRAVAAFREKKSDWIIEGENPFTGLEVTEAGCPHGNCWCDLCERIDGWTECEECMKEWDEEYSEEGTGSTETQV